MSATSFLGGGFFGGEFFKTPVTVVIDTHDGADEKRRRRRDEEFKSKREQLREMIGAAYDDAYGLNVAEEIREVAAPFVEVKAEAPQIDWERLRRDVTAEFKLRALYDEYRREMDDRDDEDAIMVLH